MSSKIRNFINSPSANINTADDQNMDKYKIKSKKLSVDISGRGVESETLKLPEFHKDMKKMQDRSVIFYGPSGSGKTMIIYDLMYRARKMFPRVIVFAPTNREKRDYEGIIPKELIYEEFGIDDIKNIYEHQRAASRAYNTANDIKILHKLFLRIATPPQRTHLKQLDDKKEKALKDVKANFREFGEQKAKASEVEQLYKSMLVEFYKRRVIQPSKSTLEQMNLTYDERMALSYLNFNPRILVVFDDAMTEIKQIIKDGKKIGDNTIEDFFFKGRWAYITHFYAFQDDNRLETEIKKNAFYSVFTSPQVASAFFSRSSSNFGKQDKARAQAVINKIFGSDDNKDDPRNKYRKLVYSRMDDNQFQYVIADLHGEFTMCAKINRDFCKKVQKDENFVDRSNPYLKKFADF